MANMKAHLIATAIVVIIAFVGLKYFDSQDKKPVANSGDDAYFIQIYSASYGENCNGSDEYEKRDENGVRKKVTLSFKRNNRLGRVSDLCNEETSCVFDVNATTLGKLKSYSCDPALKVKYRCFRIDKLQTTHLMKNDTIKIDCRPKTVKKRLNPIAESM